MTHMYTFMLSWSLNSTLQSRTGMNGTLLRATAANWAVLGMGAVPWIKGKILDERMCLDSFSGLSPRLPG